MTQKLKMKFEFDEMNFKDKNRINIKRKMRANQFYIKVLQNEKNMI